jgi:hypothetical protein
MNEKRFIDDELAFADRAEWLSFHGIKEDRRRPKIVYASDEPLRDGYCCYDHTLDWSEK